MEYSLGQARLGAVSVVKATVQVCFVELEGQLLLQFIYLLFETSLHSALAFAASELAGS